MQDLVSPRQVARAIGVSESTLKRWCDRGLIATTKTVGGHRRMEVAAVVRFLRESGRSAVEPELLGLPSGTGAGERSLRQSAEVLFQTLTADKEAAARSLVFSLLLDGLPVTSLCDDVLTPVFHRIGDTWECGEVEVYQERRACEICLRLLHEIREKILPHEAGAPLAIGAAPEKDNYTLPITMAELVLRSVGWNAAVLGSNLPPNTLQRAIADCQPRLFWMSVSYIDDESSFIAGTNQVYQTAHASGAAFVVGGRALSRSLRERIGFSVYGETFRDLERFARSLQPHDSPPTPPVDQMEELLRDNGDRETSAPQEELDAVDGPEAEPKES